MSTTDTDCTCATDRDAHRCPMHSQADYDAQQTPAPDTERDERLRGIQERAELATIGPWEIRGIEIVRDSEGLPTIQSLWVADIDPVSSDAAFIAAARTDVPWLLAEVARLDAVVTEREATIESERQAFSEVYALQVGRTTDALAVVTAVRDMVDSADGEGPVTQADGEHVPVYLIRRALDGGAS